MRGVCSDGWAAKPQGPDRPKGKWGHHIRRVPSGCLKSKAALGKLVAVEYMNFCKVR